MSDETQVTQDNDQVTLPKSFVEQLVTLKGNGKFADPEVTAKSKIESDNHIANLEKQLEELRSDLDNRLSAEDVLKQVEEKSTQLSSLMEKASQVPTDTKVDPTELENLIQNSLSKREAQSARERNLTQAQEKATELFGEALDSTVTTKAQELGLSVEDMLETAAKSPVAFLTMLGTPSGPSPSVPRNQVNTASESFSGANTRDYNYYSAMRKENPKAYYTPKVQMQMQRDSIALGDKFFS